MSTAKYQWDFSFSKFCCFIHVGLSQIGRFSNIFVNLLKVSTQKSCMELILEKKVNKNAAIFKKNKVFIN